MQKNHLESLSSIHDLKKNFNNIDIDGTFLNIIKAINEKPTANIIFNGEKLKTFSLKLEIRQQSHSCYFYLI